LNEVVIIRSVNSVVLKEVVNNLSKNVLKQESDIQKTEKDFKILKQLPDRCKENLKIKKNLTPSSLLRIIDAFSKNQKNIESTGNLCIKSKKVDTRKDSKIERFQNSYFLNYLTAISNKNFYHRNS